jgi:hypothetical protein
VKVVGRARESSYSRVLTGVKQQPDNSNFSRGDAQLSPAFETQSKSYSEKHMDSPETLGGFGAPWPRFLTESNSSLR